MQPSNSVCYDAFAHYKIIKWTTRSPGHRLSYIINIKFIYCV